MQYFSRFSFLLLVFLLSGCTEYWWTRGQPPSVDELVGRARQNLGNVRLESSREKVAGVSKRVEQQLLDALGLLNKTSNLEQINPILQSLREEFINLEGKVSVGSRAALGELSGQLRGFVKQGSLDKRVDYPAFGLFAARTLFFLSNELTVPPPSFG